MAKPWTWVKRTMRLARSGAYLGMSAEKAKYKGYRQLTYSAVIFGTTLLTFGGQVVSSTGKFIKRQASKGGERPRKQKRATRGRESTYERESYVEEPKPLRKQTGGTQGVGDVKLPSRSLEDWKREKQEAVEKAASYGEDLSKDSYASGSNVKPEGVWVSSIWEHVKKLDQDCVWVAGEEELRLKLNGDMVKVTAMGEVCMFGDVVYLGKGKERDKEMAMLDYIVYRGKESLGSFLYLMKLVDYALETEIN